MNRRRLTSFLGILFLPISSILAPFELCGAKTTDSPKSVFAQLDLSRLGLEAVKSAVAAGNDQAATEALLQYFRTRDAVKHPEVNRDKVTGKETNINDGDQKKADDGLKHVFFAHRGYKPYFYGDDINWQLWPIKDNELRFQLHRMYWWEPMGKAYWKSGDEKYAQEWVLQYRDWIKKNPLGLSADNDSFAWRALEVSHRVENQTGLFQYFVNSPSFDSEFLLTFLDNYYRHADYLRQHYSERGNHLLFEAQRMIYAGTFFPEFKDAPVWRREGIDILKKEVDRQVYPDGWQNELDPGYHIAAIQIFSRALEILKINGYEDEFSPEFKAKLEKMMLAVVDFMFPDYTYPMFSDAKLGTKSNLQKNFRSWSKIFPENQVLKYFATDGKEGTTPAHLSAAHRDAGIYTFRNGWTPKSTVLVLKAGPPAFWHSQPDNGTFGLYHNGRDFFPDSGSYVYGGDEKVLEERDWFRQSSAHNTLTLNNRDITVGARLIEWDDSDPNRIVLVYENPSYPNLTHRRSVFFLDQRFFVIIDEALGSAQGTVGVHFGFKEGDVESDQKDLRLLTAYPDQNNLLVQTFGSQDTTLKKEEGFVSYAYRQKLPRPAFAFESRKQSSPVRFVTVLSPVSDAKAPEVRVKILKATDKEVSTEVSVDGKTYTVGYQIKS